VLDKKVKFRGSGRREPFSKNCVNYWRNLSNVIITDGNDGKTGKS